MAKLLTKIVLNESDIKQLVSERYGLDKEKCTMYISYYKGDGREPETLIVTVEGSKAHQN
jgi:hypothetical protein